MTATLAAPVAVARTTPDPCPRVEVTVTPQADTSTVTMYRTSASGRVTVRGAVRAPVAGPLLVVDYEAPFGEQVSYTAVAYDAAGTPSAESPGSAPILLAVTGCPWAQDPLDPSTAMTLSPTDWQTRTFGRDSDELWPVASKSAVVLTGPRRNPGSEMTVITRTLGDAERLLALADVPVVLIRCDPSWRWRGGYFGIGELDNAGRVREMTHADQLWTLPLTPAVPPPADLAPAVHTWAEVVSLYATWADLVAAKATWADVVRNPDPGVN